MFYDHFSACSLLAKLGRDEIKNKYCCFWCLDFALVDCICMEDV